MLELFLHFFDFIFKLLLLFFMLCSEGHNLVVGFLSKSFSIDVVRVLGRGILLCPTNGLSQLLALILSRGEFFPQGIDSLAQMQVLGLGLVQGYSLDINRVLGLRKSGVGLFLLALGRLDFDDHVGPFFQL